MYWESGIVLCPCGGTIISNSGKIIGSIKRNTISCWNCGKEYNATKVYKQRIHEQTVTFEDENE